MERSTILRMQRIKIPVSKRCVTLAMVNGVFLTLLGSVLIKNPFPYNGWAIGYRWMMALTLAPGVGIKGIFGMIIIPVLISMSFLNGVFWMAYKNKWKKWKTCSVVLTYFVLVFILNAMRAEW